MILIRTAAQLPRFAGTGKPGTGTGFVPTMGALHEGHLALIRAAKAAAGTTWCSIFVNPTQFNVASDFEKYPVSTASDVAMLEKAGTDFLYLPGVADIYPAGVAALERYDLGDLETRLEGSARPGHFQGVCQVMSRLLRAVAPDDLFMGRKDYQQCMVIRRLIEILGIPVRLHVIPTVREHDGLAMSSRNRRLTPEQRAKAPALYLALKAIRDGLRPGETETLRAQAEKDILAAGFRPDYVSIADAGTLAPVAQWDGSQPLVALVAAFAGEVRLIDNLGL